MNIREARERFEALAKGQYVPQKLSVQKARERLRQVDPGLDVSRVLRALDEGDIKRAGMSLAVEAAASQALAYFYPLIVDAVEMAVNLIPKKKPDE